MINAAVLNDRDMDLIAGGGFFSKGKEKEKKVEEKKKNDGELTDGQRAFAAGAGIILGSALIWLVSRKS